MRGYLSVRKWDHYQHYKHPRPLWIKLYTTLLDEEDLRVLPVTTRLLWTELLLLAARHANVLRNDPGWISMLTGIEPEACREGVDQLLQGRWLLETETTRRYRPRSRAASRQTSRAESREPSIPRAGERAAMDFDFGSSSVGLDSVVDFDSFEKPGISLSVVRPLSAQRKTGFDLSQTPLTEGGE